MSIVRIDVFNVRNIQKASICPSNRINLISGCNGSGKTSFLEAIYLLALGKSFRTHHVQKVVTSGADSLIVFAEYLSNHNTVTVGVERGEGNTRLRINGNNVGSVAELAHLIPVQLINPDSHQLIELGPRYRRQFVDWGMFHVEQEFFPVWCRFNQALRQRNAALRLGAQDSEIAVWHGEMSACAVRISQLRSSYISELMLVARDAVSSMLGEEIDIRFIPGWPADEPYETYLTRTTQLDRNAGYTRQGPHRADLAICVNGLPARDRVSRGEQKVLATALRLAQIELMRKKTGQPCVVLLDDLPSELDHERRSLVIDYLEGLGCQTFVTATDQQLLEDKGDLIDKVFHVEHGNIKEMV
ncbi:MAG TPA: DNA replication/repair protein RecF [Gammaproteobacteria bacterium]|nr:DNA replication/repair protein RecF [Gammaproteobacteria bacterium]